MPAKTPKETVAKAHRANFVDSPQQKSLLGHPSIHGAIYPKTFSPDPQKEPGGMIGVQNEKPETTILSSPASTNKALLGNLLRTTPNKPSLPPLTYAAALRKGIAHSGKQTRIQQNKIVANGGGCPCAGDTAHGDAGNGWTEVANKKSRTDGPEPGFSQTARRSSSARYNSHRDNTGKFSQTLPRNAIQRRNGRPERQAAVVSITAPMLQPCIEPQLDDVFLVRFSQKVNMRNQEIWRQILRVDRKNRHRVRKDCFTKAMEAAGFTIASKGGSHYTFTPKWLSKDPKPISFHLHWAMIEPTELGHKSQSIRDSYPSMVRSMYAHWGIEYDPCADRR